MKQFLIGFGIVAIFMACLIGVFTLVDSNTEHVQFDTIGDSRVACYEDYSYLIGQDGSYTPTPDTLSGRTDIDCIIEGN